MTTLPGGTVTFVFTDIEGSTRLLQELGDEDYARTAADHRRIVRGSFDARGGTEIDTQGDAFFYSFPRARDAVGAAIDAQRELQAHDWPQGKHVLVRMGLHTGEPHIGEEGYLGIDVVRAARISAAGNGGQILVSETTRALLGNQLPEGAAVHDLGKQNLKDIQHEHIYEISVDGRPASGRALKTDRAGALEARFEERIEAFVEHQLEQALSGIGAARASRQEPSGRHELPALPTKLAGGAVALGLGSLLALAVVVILIALLVKLAFF